MTRSPLRGTRRSHQDDSRSPREQAQEVVSLAKAISDRLIIPVGPPHTEEEKRAAYLALARLRAQRRTRAECAEALGVSVSSVARYLADPLYEEVCTDHMAESKQRGHFLIAEMTDDALNVIYDLMFNGKSEFVRYKAAEKLLDVAGYNIPREEQQKDSREGLQQFMDELRRRAERQQPQVTVNINQQHSAGSAADNQEETMIEATTSSPAPALPPYSSQVLPGGKLPTDFLQAIDHHPVDHGRPEQLFGSRLRQEDDGDDPYS